VVPCGSEGSATCQKGQKKISKNGKQRSRKCLPVAVLKVEGKKLLFSVDN
jgi:hypothetical protein